MGHENAGGVNVAFIVASTSQYVRYYRQLLGHMIKGKDTKNVMPCALESLSKFGEHPEILHHFTALNLYTRGSQDLRSAQPCCSKFP